MKTQRKRKNDIKKKQHALSHIQRSFRQADGRRSVASSLSLISQLYTVCVIFLKIISTREKKRKPAVMPDSLTKISFQSKGNFLYCHEISLYKMTFSLYLLKFPFVFVVFNCITSFSVYFILFLFFS